ncbi:hypothetical protein [Arthrobacter crystallopoietes]|uniref:hypothetical protein n=1 Tax=Crystallibacter crystallopoietes TaxID=37928 RepID=UPI001111334A|nr:hypothetical protein [Arthrobacter crystallopoietes]
MTAAWPGQKQAQPVAGHPDEAPELQLAELIDAIEQPGNQGELLKTRDYVLLMLATVALPLALILIGGLL